MATHEHDQDSIPAGARQFVTTRWTIVLNAGGTETTQAAMRGAWLQWINVSCQSELR